MSEEQRATLLSDDECEVMRKHFVFLFSGHKVTAHEAYWYALLDMRKRYEAKITSGELMVVKTIDGDPIEHIYQCAGVHIIGAATERINHCPGCGAKIIKP